jgi:hypothetical protein
VVRRHVRYGRRAIISDDYVDLRLVEGTEFAALENTTREGVLNRRTPPPRHSRGHQGQDLGGPVRIYSPSVARKIS